MSLSTRLSSLTRQLPPETFDKVLRWIGHLFFGVLLLMSLLYYKERLLHFDAANYTFQLLYYEDFYIGHGRWISAPTQLLPLLAIKLGASLRAVLMIYSASFILFYYSIFLIVVYGFRQAKVGIFLALVLCLAMRYKFYGPVGEVILSMGSVALLLGWLWRGEVMSHWSRHWNYLFSFLLMLILVLTGHPFAALSLLFVMGFYWISAAKWWDREFWIMMGTALLLLGRKYFSLQKEGSYEAGQMDNLQEGIKLLGSFQEYYVFDRILHFLDTEYAFPFAIFCLCLVVLLYQKKWMLTAFLLVSHLGMLAAIMVSFSYLNDPIYILLDGYLSHLGVIWALPMVFVLLEERRVWSVALMILLLGFGLDRIHEKRSFFQQRTEIIGAIMEPGVEQGHRKLLHHMDHFDWQRLWLPWAVGVETLMYTALQDPEQAATLYYQQARLDEEEHALEGQSFLGVQYDPFLFKLDSLPSKWFLLPEGPYHRIVPQN
ncbi:MAG: hypothetical protein KTR30_38035 [Saprospiraceae bacterium]|nr:hypothetical protein [Saprospiraceae bacterium]